jgi:hypothetical protein
LKLATVNVLELPAVALLAPLLLEDEVADELPLGVPVTDT